MIDHSGLDLVLRVVTRKRPACSAVHLFLKSRTLKVAGREEQVRQDRVYPQTGRCPHRPEVQIRKLFMSGASAALLIGLSPHVGYAASPAAPVMTSMPNDSMTMTDWYKQNVYDQGDNKIGDIKDVLVGKEGKISALIIAVGGFLGAGEKDVAAPSRPQHWPGVRWATPQLAAGALSSSGF